METNLMCRLCSSAPAVVFSLSSTAGKIPLCGQDIPKFIASNGGEYSTIFPIAAIDFINTAFDLPLYEQRIQKMRKCEQVLETIVAADEEQFQQAVLMLQENKESMIAYVSSEFDRLIANVRSSHKKVKKGVESAKREIAEAKRKKGAELSSSVEQITSNIETEKRDLRYVVCSKSSDSSIRKIIQSGFELRVSDELQLLIEKSRRTKEVNVQQLVENTEPKEERQVKSSEKVIKRSKLIQCVICNQMQPKRYFIKYSPYYHDRCLVCIYCIKPDSNNILLCPICKRDYESNEKKYLKKKLKTVLHLDMTGFIWNRRYCQSCNKDLQLDVFLNNTATCKNCEGKRKTLDVYGKPTYEEIRKYPYLHDSLFCFQCCKKLRISTVAHWCQGIFKLFCCDCQPDCGCQLTDKEKQHFTAQISTLNST